MRCKRDEEYANNKFINNTMIEETLFVAHSIKIIKVIILILNASYLVGMIWLIILEYIEIEVKHSHFKDWKTVEELEKGNVCFVQYPLNYFFSRQYAYLVGAEFPNHFNMQSFKKRGY